jgi:hypothetical protein
MLLWSWYSDTKSMLLIDLNYIKAIHIEFPYKLIWIWIPPIVCKYSTEMCCFFNEISYWFFTVLRDRKHQLIKNLAFILKLIYGFTRQNQFRPKKKMKQNFFARLVVFIFRSIYKEILLKILVYNIWCSLNKLRPVLSKYWETRLAK